MKLVIDIGNTNIKLAVFDKHVIKQLEIIHTKSYKRLPNFKNVNDCVIGSVVPSLNQQISNDVYKKFHIKPWIVNVGDFDSEFNLSKFDKNEIGLDILAFAYAIKSILKKGIGISFGTATFAVVVNKDIIHGVAIAPSFDNGLSDLTKNTALIKNINIDHINFDFGNNTQLALCSGITHSVNGFINSISSYARKLYGISNVYVSGGKDNWVELTDKIQRLDNAILIGYDLISN